MVTDRIKKNRLYKLANTFEYREKEELNIPELKFFTNEESIVLFCDDEGNAIIKSRRWRRGKRPQENNLTFLENIDIIIDADEMDEFPVVELLDKLAENKIVENKIVEDKQEEPKISPLEDMPKAEILENPKKSKRKSKVKVGDKVQCH